jgi:adenylate cyclase
MQRRLTAILAADVVGYSRLMGAEEAGTLASLKLLLKDLVQPRITGRGGRIVKLMGDGLLAEFPSVVEAVHCAIEIQQAMPGREADQPDDRRIALRIGVNLGDIIVEGSDIYGDGVNVTARLEALAEPNGICISSTVMDQVKGKLDRAFKDLGEVEVKNIERPIHVFGWPETTALPSGSVTSRPNLSGKPSIAVLPFTNMSGKPEQDSFVDGLTEDIITGLSRVRWYDVKARNSTFAYKGTLADVREIGRALNVAYVLEGSVRKGATSLRITAQLIDAGNGNHVWADRFDRELGDDFAVQDEIAQRVASVLGERIWQDVAKHIGSKQETDYTAYDYTYTAINMLHRLEPDDVVTARGYLLKALELNPDLHTCHTGLGFCYLVEALYLGTIDGDAIEEAHKHGLKLLEMAPDDAQTYRLLSRTYWAKGQHAEAWQSVQRALRLNPNDGDIIANRGVYHLFKGEFEAAHEWIDKVLAMHDETPHTTDIMHHWKAMASFGARDYQGALAQLGQISGLPYLKNLFLASCHAELGNQAQAEASLRSILTARPDLRLSALRFWQLFDREDDRRHFRNALQKAGLPD